MVPEGDQASLTRSSLRPGWVTSAQREHSTAPVILPCHPGLKQNEDSLLPGLLSWQLPPAVTPEKGQDCHMRRPSLARTWEMGAFLHEMSYCQCGSNCLLMMSGSWVHPHDCFLLEFETRPNSFMIPGRTPPSQCVNENHLGEN